MRWLRVVRGCNDRQELHELHRNGAQTDEEFARAKERLIGASHRPELA